MLIDANVFKGYYQMDLGKGHDLCGCPQTLFRAVTAQTPVFHDDGRIVEEEWRRVVDRDWFDAWLSASLQSGLVEYLKPSHDASVEKKLQALGFPKGRDIIYVRLGLSATAKRGPCSFYTEDQ